jgi:hypothetical protein
VLGQLSVVCRKWREVSLREAWWGRVAEDMLPLLWEEEEQAGQAGSSRGRVVQYGRFLEGQRDPFKWKECGDEWWYGLEAHAEIYDRMDGLQLLSIRGPIDLNDDDAYVAMFFIHDSPLVQIKNAAFSAASRDPVGRRFASMEEYFTRGHGEEYPCCLCIRVTLRDTRTGRMAVVWEEDNGGAVFEYETHDAEAGHYYCASIRQRRPQQHMVGQLVRQMTAPGTASFHVSRVPNQAEGVSEQDALYRIELGDGGVYVSLMDPPDAEGARVRLETFKWVLQAAMA